MYYYSTNVQGDVVSILDSTGNPVDGYTYDAWGNQSTNSGTSTIGALNPLRYRGYAYDTETGLYYLQSRYYNPETGRFLNADVFTSTGQGILGNNMFAYCRNNPVCRKDISGTTDVALPDDNTDLLDEEKAFNGGRMSNGDPGIQGNNSGKYNFKSEADLNNHFEKHNPEFENPFNTPQEYVDAANYVIQNGEYVANQNAYVMPYGTTSFAFYSFVGLTHDHSFITTFHLKHVSRIRF